MRLYTLPENQKEHLKNYFRNKKICPTAAMVTHGDLAILGCCSNDCRSISVFIFFDPQKKALLLGFFGFNIHVWFTYADIVGARYSVWSYPFQAIPFLTVSFGLDASLVSRSIKCILFLFS